jgi:quinol monooxygenase YgiN
MRENIQWTVQLNVKEGQLDASKALAKEMSEATQSEEGGALQYEWFYTADGAQCHILEEYKHSEAALAHLDNFMSKYVERFMGCYEPAGFHVYGNPSEKLIEVLQPFGPVYMGMKAGFVR